MGGTRKDGTVTTRRGEEWKQRSKQLTAGGQAQPSISLLTAAAAKQQQTPHRAVYLYSCNTHQSIAIRQQHKPTTRVSIFSLAARDRDLQLELARARVALSRVLIMSMPIDIASATCIEASVSTELASDRRRHHTRGCECVEKLSFVAMCGFSRGQRNNQANCDRDLISWLLCRPVCSPPNCPAAP